MSEFENSVEWQQSEGALLEVAEAQAAERPTSAPGAGGDNEKHAPTRHHGFKADMARHERIASVVDRYAPSWRTGSMTFRKEGALEKICTDLDQTEIDIPDSWKRGATPSLGGAKLKDWKDALQVGGNKLVADQIRTSLNKLGRGTARSRHVPTAS